MKKLNQQVWKAIKSLRIQQGLTQEEFAEAADIHDKHVGRIERGTHGITLEYLCKTAKGLNINVTELVGRIFEANKTEENKESILKDIQAVLKTQPVDVLKSLQKLNTQFIVSRSGKKSVFLLEVKAEKDKKNGITILTKKI